MRGETGRGERESECLSDRLKMCIELCRTSREGLTRSTVDDRAMRQLRNLFRRERRLSLELDDVIEEIHEDQGERI